MSVTSQLSNTRAVRGDAALRRRNIFTALGLVFVMIPLVPYVQEKQIGWFMWRDAPILAATFTGLAVIMAIGWLRTPRTSAS